MDFIVVLSVAFGLVLLCHVYSVILARFTRKNYAPGPWGFPLVGHLPLFGTKTTITFQRWAKRYGNIFRIRLGSWNTVILNGHSVVVNALERQDDAFSGRPDFHSTKITREFRGNEDSVEFGPFNVAYLKQRKLTAYALRKLTQVRGDYIQELILNEAKKLVEKILSKEKESQTVAEEVTLSAASVIYQVLFGKGGNVREDEHFRQILENLNAFTDFVGSGNAIDVMPWLRFFLRKKMVDFLQLVNTSNKLIWQKVQDHKNSLHADKFDDVTAVFLAAQLPETVNDKETDVSEARQLFTLSDLLGAGFSTTSTTLLWLIVYVMAYPEVQRKVQFEIDNVVGTEGTVTLKDRSQLHYTQATITEVLRLCNTAPLALPHCTTMDTTLNGFHIDKGTVILVNLDSVNKDETVWENPMTFNPERHLNGSNEFEKRNKVYPFGLGRRRCVGEFLAKTELFLFFSTLMQRCAFKKPETESIDLEPLQTIVNSPRPFRVIVEKRK